MTQMHQIDAIEDCSNTDCLSVNLKMIADTFILDYFFLTLEKLCSEKNPMASLSVV